MAYTDPTLLLSLLSLFMHQPPTQRCAPSCVTLQNARQHRTTTPPLTTIVLRILYCLRGQCGSRLKCTETRHKLFDKNQHQACQQGTHGCWISALMAFIAQGCFKMNQAFYTKSGLTNCRRTLQQWLGNGRPRSPTPCGCWISALMCFVAYGR